MRLPRAVLTGLIATATALALSVGSSAAADRGHARTREAMDAVVQERHAPGVLGHAEDGGGVWSGSSGTADLRTLQPRMPQDRFRIGSLTKPFVATVLLQLESEGKVRLDDPVGRWLPDVPLGRYGAGIGDRSRPSRTLTVRQLLGHTSGIPNYTADPVLRRDYFSTRFLTRRWTTHTPEGLSGAALAQPPLFAPGTKWSYSNTNYLLAGMIIERATGHSYAHEIERRIVRALKLHDTSLPGTSPRIPGQHGRAYSTLFVPKREAEVHDVTAFNPSFAGPAGEMISSTHDLVRFVRALLTGGLLPPRQLQEMKSSVAVPDGDRYGLGLTRRTLSCGVTVWGHEGTIHGSRSSAFTTEDGTHTAAFNINGDWSGDTRPLVDTEFCGT
ncbi:serine hydrolase domain-containing protein [Streptomyces iconiensis]|uniref:Serine hydrolase domain-containing protein n=1 Tax=Streptomyces iconiensis TaxID=1384038 RepID=A0ABT7A5M9_9ACTN|nr:serine hydrolase domain-containing protein [Streptomyces iconiensis]MDJ1136591.1 serine hydrolase domain-containing protein [Streptomyces iconiensis]